MARKRRALLQLSTEDMEKLLTYSSSRTASSSIVNRSKIIIDYSSGMTIAEIVRKYKTNRPLVERTVDKAIEFGSIAALSDLPRSGRPIEITDEARAWVISIACEAPSKFGFAAETWTYSSLIKYIRKNCTSEGYP